MVEQTVSHAPDLLSEVFRLIPAGAALIRLADGSIVDVNEGFERILGYSRADVVGRTTAELRLYVDPDDHACIARLVGERGFVDGHEVQGRHRSGTPRDMLLSAQSLDLDGQPCLLLIFQDITERKPTEAMARDSEARYRALQQSATNTEATLHRKNIELAETMERLHNLSLTDELTGLHNRRGFLNLAAKQLKLAERADYAVRLLFMDVDGLKHVNDTFGHQAGDAALAATAGILRHVFRGSDILARIGGDEFAVLAVNAAENSMDVIRTRLYGSLEAHNAQSGHPYVLSFSLGEVSVLPNTAQTVEELLAEADVAMYADKLRTKQQGST